MSYFNKHLGQIILMKKQKNYTTLVADCLKAEKCEEKLGSFFRELLESRLNELIFLNRRYGQEKRQVLCGV